MEYPDPIIIIQCKNQHNVCNACYTNPSFTKSCPICRASMKGKARNRLAEKLLNLTEKQCTNKGCNEMIQRIQFKEHVLQKCAFTAVSCKYAKLGCEWNGTKNERLQHEKECNVTLDQALEILLQTDQKNQELLEANDQAKAEFDEYLATMPNEGQKDSEKKLCHLHWDYYKNCVIFDPDDGGISGYIDEYKDVTDPFGDIEDNPVTGHIKICHIGSGLYDIKMKFSWVYQHDEFRDADEHHLKTFVRGMGYKNHTVNITVYENVNVKNMTPGRRGFEIKLNDEPVDETQLELLRESDDFLVSLLFGFDDVEL